MHTLNLEIIIRLNKDYDYVQIINESKHLLQISFRPKNANVVTEYLIRPDNYIILKDARWNICNYYFNFIEEKNE